MAGALARALNAPGGIGVERACARAAQNLEDARERALDHVRDCLSDIVAIAGAPPEPELRRELHRLSCAIAGLGGMFQRDALSRAAYSFCRYLDEAAPGWNAEAARIHVQAMCLLASPERVPAEEQVKIIEGLAKVRRAVAGGAGAS